MSDLVKSRRSVLALCGSTLLLAGPWVRPATAQSVVRVRDSLIEAQYGTFQAAAMSKLWNNAFHAHSTNGFDGSSFETANLAMENRFPDDTRSEVFGGGCSALFFRYNRDQDNACSAWLNKCFRNDGCCDSLMSNPKIDGSQIVTFVEGPMNVAIYSMIEDFGSHLVDFRGFDFAAAQQRAREIIAPMNSDKLMFSGNFYSLSGSDRYDSEHAKIEVQYSSASNGGEAVYSVRDRATNDLLYENYTYFPMI